MAISVSLPAMAVNPVAASIAAPTSSRSSHDSQSVSVAAGTASIAVSADSYSYTAEVKPQQLAPGAYASTSTNFTNNPLSPVQWPFVVGVPISSDFGPREAPCSGCSTDHKGLDMNPGINTPIQAIANGVVVEASAYDNGGFGVYAVIEHVIDGEVITSLYAHMREESLALSVGQQVTVGQQVGNVGSTGQSTGAHLHFEIHRNGTPIDPFAWLTERVQ